MTKMSLPIESKRNRQRRHARHAESNTQGARNTRRKIARAPIDPARNALLTTPRVVLGGIALAALTVLVWAYWPTLVELTRVWNSDPDYSHGYFVLPVALFFLWARREQFPGVSQGHMIWPGVLLLGMGAAMRYVAAVYFMEPVDGWSLLFWAAGAVWLAGGWRWLRWALPSIAFLLFMVPLPFRVERMLSLPLQRVAATLSGWTLQILGLPAYVQGNTIQLGEQTLEVERACSGLTIFIGIAALAFAYVVLVKRSWWEKGLLLAAVLPIALIANSARIVLTGLLYEFVSSEAAQKFSHDLAGYVMLPFAAALFALTLAYLGRLFPRTHEMVVRGIIQQQAADVS